MNLQESKTNEGVFYSFVGLPNTWVSDNDRTYKDNYFKDKEYEDFYFDSFYDMDKEFGHENSLFGTRGLPVGHPNRKSSSFDTYHKRFGPAIVRVVKDTNLQENIQRIQEMMVINESKGWGDSKQKLERTFKFKDFNESIEFVNKVAKIAEQQNHHPDIDIKYNKVKISITDHEKGGVSEKCHKLVKAIDKLKEPHKEEQNESELTEKCWTGYTQKGMKTMFGKRYPNCVKKTK